MKDLFSIGEKQRQSKNFKAVRISLASPEKIQEWSHGEVKKPETINYRTYKPEREGLFCAKIFGPIRDYECLCGKYRRMKHKGVVCEKCGVEVISSKVRRERMGHITLATPVAHTWFLRSHPSRIGNLLELTHKQVEQVLNCESYIVTDPGNTDLEKKQILSEEEYERYLDEFGDGSFKADMGGEAIYQLLSEIDVDALVEDIKRRMEGVTNSQRRKTMMKSLKIARAFQQSGNRPEWMMIKILPVLPPDLRPLVPLDGGRFASSDLNDLYRKVITRNNRLKKLLDSNAPDIILRNEKRMLQEAVDSLLDNSNRQRSATGANRRPLKSLTDVLKGKQGRFRQNLLGKRVDYSGRSVIVVGPELRLHQCGLPKIMALELFKPFIYNKLEEKGFAKTIKAAKKMVENQDEKIWDVLEEVIKEHPIMLNRAPTLHRLGIQAFEPVLIEGKAIQLHPLVCTAFNADFDGDQMAVHVPLSIKAQIEARVLMMSTNNILGPAHGKPIIVPTQDIVLGMYYVSRDRPVGRGRYKTDENGIPISGFFSSPEEVRIAFDQGVLDIHARIKVRISTWDMEGNPITKIFDTTTGRILIYDLLPDKMPFDLVNKVINKKQLGYIIDYCYRHLGEKETVLLADALRTFGYYYSTKAGVSIAIDDMHIPKAKKHILEEAYEEMNEELRSREEGLITESEYHNKVVDLWIETSKRVAQAMQEEIKQETVWDPETGEAVESPSFNPIYIMAESGARGSEKQLRQLAAMRGLFSKPNGEIIEAPITTNLREGLTVHQYFISTHGARKGLADTALKTANSGYLTRRLVDVSQDSGVLEFDCGTTKGIEVSKIVRGGRTIEDIDERILGRIALEDIVDPYTEEIIVLADEMIDEEKLKRIKEVGIDSVKIRSVLTCEAAHGVCAMCYGRDLARGHLVQVGEAIGIIAAQSIGEPGTQLTMRTFHTGGTASGGGSDHTSTAHSKGIVKLDGVETTPNINPETGEQNGWIVMSKGGRVVIVDDAGHEKEHHEAVYGANLFVEDNQHVDAGTKLMEWAPYSDPILAEVDGYVKFEDMIERTTYQVDVDNQGIEHYTIIDYSKTNYKPRILITDEHGNVKKIPGTNLMAEIALPAKAVLDIKEEGKFVVRGQRVANVPKDSSKTTRDITTGLPRVVELFEARKPKEPAIITEIDGIVSFGPDYKGKRRVIITPPHGEPREYLVPKGKHIRLREGEYVRAGDALIDGSPNPHDILRVLGPERLAQFLVEEIQEVYRGQGVRINDKHIEVIVRQMLRKVRIVDPGDTDFMEEEQVDKVIFERENRRVMTAGGRPAQAEPILVGITRAALTTESFISAASFQETTKVLTEAAIWGKTDYLVGLKENVITGRVIPAGTGLEAYQRLTIETDDPIQYDEHEDVYGPTRPSADLF